MVVCYYDFFLHLLEFTTNSLAGVFEAVTSLGHYASPGGLPAIANDPNFNNLTQSRASSTSMIFIINTM